MDKGSESERAGRGDIEEGGAIPLISKPKLRLYEEDFEELDRKQLHADGVLSDEEFAAAKGRVLGAGGA